MDGRGKSHLFGGDGKPKPAVQKLLDAGYAVASADVVLTGEHLDEGKPGTYPVIQGFPGYTFCYNRPLLELRVRDVVAARAAMGVRLKKPDTKTPAPVHVVGTGDAGLWALLSAASRKCRPDEKVIVDLVRFSFENVTKADDPNLLPGALKYGDVDGLAALAAPAMLSIHRPSGAMPLLSKATAITKGSMQTTQEELTDDAVVEQILKAK